MPSSSATCFSTVKQDHSTCFRVKHRLGGSQFVMPAVDGELPAAGLRERGRENADAEPGHPTGVAGQ